MDVSLADRDPDAPLEPFALRDGTTITATVKSFNEQRGFGFLKIPGASMDLYFHGRDMDDASQGLLMRLDLIAWLERPRLVGGPGLSNCHATCRVEARADGRWNGRNVSLLESGTQMWDGMKMAGMISYFYDHKGFGFINVTGNPIDIYFHRPRLSSKEPRFESCSRRCGAGCAAEMRAGGPYRHLRLVHGLCADG